MKNIIYLIVTTIFLLAMTSCSVKDRKVKTGLVTFNSPKANSRLVIFTSKQCLISPSSRYTQESVLGSLILASLAKTAITEGFSAINDYAIKKATSDSEGKTFTAYNNSFMYEGIIAKPTVDVPKKIAITTSLNTGCITILKESDEPISTSKWLDAFVKKLSITPETVTKALSENSVNNAPSFFFQVGIIFHNEFGIYEVKPALLNYMEPLGGSKVKNGKDLAITIEVSAPGSADKPALQFSYDFNDISAFELFESEHLTSYGSMFYAMVPYNSELKSMQEKIDAVNNSLTAKMSFIDSAEIKLNDNSVEIKNGKCTAQSTDDKCKALMIQKDALNTQIKTAKNELKVIDKQRSDLKRVIGNKAKKASPINLKASVTEVGDINKFWEVVAKFTGGLKDDVKTYAKAKYDKITDTYTEAEKITDSNNKLTYQISLANFDMAFKALKDAKDEEKPTKYVACLTVLKALNEAAIKVQQVATQTCEL